MNNFWKYTAIIFFGVSVILLILSRCNKVDGAGSIDVKRDTIVRYLPQKIVEIKQAKPKIIYLKDTFYQSPPFIARLDTVILHDTIKTEFTFPENYFSMKYLPEKDSVIEINTKIIKKKEKHRLKELSLFLGGLILGILITK
ncbi:MAG: hypothetical protein A2X64_02865 [Ignavibacteria bacterium GWF2_33_9]|nr:MAG: hypothetical protein A2X64_02865 [Ignavibacteria bacterium GWF2_33_9]